MLERPCYINIPSVAGTNVAYLGESNEWVGLVHPRRVPVTARDVFEWGTINNRSYFLAEAILRNELSDVDQDYITPEMIEAFQRDCLAKIPPTDALHIPVERVRDWIRSWDNNL